MLIQQGIVPTLNLVTLMSGVRGPLRDLNSCRNPLKRLDRSGQRHVPAAGVGREQRGPSPPHREAGLVPDALSQPRRLRLHQDRWFVASE